MKNAIPRYLKPLVALAEKVADGLHTLQVLIGMAQNTEDKVRAEIAAIKGKPAGPGGVPPAVEGLEGQTNRLRREKSAQTDRLTDAIQTGRMLAMTVVPTLWKVLGKKWNSKWIPVGFNTNSLIIPADPMDLLISMSRFFANNPTLETPNVGGFACTAAGCEAVAQAISDAQAAQLNGKKDYRLAKVALDTAVSSLYQRLIGTRTELEQLLADDDPRWLAFGFHMPGRLSIPEVPANLVAILGAIGSGSIFFKWDAAVRADSSRIVIKNTAGVELVNEIVGSSEFMATNLPVGQTVTVIVMGHNRAGDSQPTAPLTVVVP